MTFGIPWPEANNSVSGGIFIGAGAVVTALLLAAVARGRPSTWAILAFGGIAGAWLGATLRKSIGGLLPKPGVQPPSPPPDEPPGLVIPCERCGKKPWPDWDTGGSVGVRGGSHKGRLRPCSESPDLLSKAGLMPQVRPRNREPAPPTSAWACLDCSWPRDSLPSDFPKRGHDHGDVVAASTLVRQCD
jgi:hypothetical protein